MTARSIRLEERDDQASALLETVKTLRDDVLCEGQARFLEWQNRISRPEFRESALNLAVYLALRSRNLQTLQNTLTTFGLSSLGRLEGRVRTSLDAVVAALSAIACGDGPQFDFPPAHLFVRGSELLHANTTALFGRGEGQRRTKLLVTLPAEAASDGALAAELVRSGVDAVRINCAHDNTDTWANMMRNIRVAGDEAGRRIAVLMDLAGPKCRTGAICTRDQGRLFKGDYMLLARRDFRPLDEWPVQTTCTIPTIFDHLTPGAHIWFDDGRLGGVVESTEDDAAIVMITHAAPKGVRLKADKGLNFPDTELGVAALTGKDLADLDFAAMKADMIGYSFVQTAEDISGLQAELKKRRGSRWAELGLIAKIETPRAIHNLPEIMVEAAGRQPFAVMIARGDLAVELGFTRLAEMQEEILWLCEAARVPVIWATQVLEGLVKKGLPSRGEMTDAAMACRAECIMLNKGPYVTEAVDVLNRLTTRMGEHQLKKTPILRALRSW